VLKEGVALSPGRVVSVDAGILQEQERRLALSRRDKKGPADERRGRRRRWRCWRIGTRYMWYGEGPGRNEERDVNSSKGQREIVGRRLTPASILKPGGKALTGVFLGPFRLR
jgi:hypothetical protein